MNLKFQSSSIADVNAILQLLSTSSSLVFSVKIVTSATVSRCKVDVWQLCEVRQDATRRIYTDGDRQCTTSGIALSSSVVLHLEGGGGGMK